MVRADVVYLVAEAPEVRGVFDEKTTQKRLVFCVVRSVGMREVYEAKGHELEPEYVFVLSDYDEYKGEKIAEYNGQSYNVIRTYVNGQKIELTVTRRG